MRYIWPFVEYTYKQIPELLDVSALIVKLNEVFTVLANVKVLVSASFDADVLVKVSPLVKVIAGGSVKPVVEGTLRQLLLLPPLVSVLLPLL